MRGSPYDHVVNQPSTWRRSTRCASAACVEVADQPDTVLVRDSKQAGSPVLQFDHAAWAGFVAGLKGGTLGQV